MRANHPPRTPTGPSRRVALQLGATSTAAWLVGAPAIHAREPVTLRVVGTDVTLHEEIRTRAQKDLGIHLEFTPLGSAAALQKASSRPESFDVYEQWSNSLGVLWNANTIQPIDKGRIRAWNEINLLPKTGKLTPEMQIAPGDSPHRLLYVQPDKSLGATETDFLSFVPYVHNVDAFGYNTSVIAAGTPYDSESWGWLLDDRYRGRVSLVNEPAIGIFDAALAATAQGLISIRDLGNMTRDELDALFHVLVRFKRNGHFTGMWNSVAQSVDHMRKGRAVIESMFSPAVSILNGIGVPVRYAAPREGYRAWYGVLCVSRMATGAVLDAAYDYMNWWLEGWAGAHMARQGYYISVPERARNYLANDEWEYWYCGAPAARNLPGADGRTAVRRGELRSGGAYEERLRRIAVWNTVMDSYEYSLVRWYEFLTT